MSQSATYQTQVSWKGDHLGHISMGNGTEMDFSSPPDAKGLPEILTPEDAFVAAVNTCIMMMFLWSCERLKLELLSYACKAVGTKVIDLDHTETFSEVRLEPRIAVRAGGENPEHISARVRRALNSAQKYSLVANSIKSRVIIVPQIEIIQ